MKQTPYLAHSLWYMHVKVKQEPIKWSMKDTCCRFENTTTKKMWSMQQLIFAWWKLVSKHAIAHSQYQKQRIFLVLVARPGAHSTDQKETHSLTSTANIHQAKPPKRGMRTFLCKPIKPPKESKWKGSITDLIPYMYTLRAKSMLEIGTGTGSQGASCGIVATELSINLG